MKRFLFYTAILEALAGAAALAAPSLFGRLLLAAVMTSADDVLVRLCGAALLALGVACWLGRGDLQAGTARALGSAMLVYNLGAVAVLAAWGVEAPPSGIALWPAVILHVGMAGWCVMALIKPVTRGQAAVKLAPPAGL